MSKKITPFLIILLLIFSAWYLYNYTIPKNDDWNKTELKYSTENALQHVKNIAQAPHFVGSAAHSQVRNYIVNELQELGLEVQTQEGYSLNKYGILTYPINILAKIPGSDSRGNALLLMSHYDSAGHSSFGASDAGSGVAIILEGIRAFIESGEGSKNDIIILFTDAEELGLNGAELFVTQHPWAKDAKLALNFEARGSGGNSIMFPETTNGNKMLIADFVAAHPQFAVTNSLIYSVYKLMPNDTDLTVMREKGNISGFNFAFIGDHFDYHTALDKPENLDVETLRQQASYFISMLQYFKNADLDKLDSAEDWIYFNIPGGNIIHYPFSWIFPLLILAICCFLLVLFFGFYKRKLQLKIILKSSLAFFASLIGSGVIAFLFWKLSNWVYSGYSEILQGFTYNGTYYIVAVIFLSLAICFYSYKRFAIREQQASTFVIPLFFWLIIGALASFFLKGASYFIVPFFFGIIQLLLMITQRRPNLFLMFILSLPAMIILYPLILMFPVALGLKILFVTAILTVLLFSLFLPVFSYFNGKRLISAGCFLIFIILVLAAQFKHSFSAERPKPNSLVYVLDRNTNLATWNSYDNYLDFWNSKYFESSEKKKNLPQVFGSKYGNGFTFSNSAPFIDLQPPGIIYEKLNPQDSLGNNRYSLKIAPNRHISMMTINADAKINFTGFKVNGKQADSIKVGNENRHIFKDRWNSRLLTYYAANQDTLRMEFTVKGNAPQFELLEVSYDLLDNKQLHVISRKPTMIPRPFVINDAVIQQQTINFNEKE